VAAAVDANDDYPCFCCLARIRTVGYYRFMHSCGLHHYWTDGFEFAIVWLPSCVCMFARELASTCKEWISDLDVKPVRSMSVPGILGFLRT